LNQCGIRTKHTNHGISAIRHTYMLLPHTINLESIYNETFLNNYKLM